MENNIKNIEVGMQFFLMASQTEILVNQTAQGGGFLWLPPHSSTYPMP